MSVSRSIAAIRRDLSNPLYRNAYALMLGTAITGGLGLVYWALAARLYDVKDVGAATGLLTAMMLVSALTQLNFMQVLIRFLPRAGTATKQLILTAYAIAAGFATVAATILALIAHAISNNGDTFHFDLPTGIWFVIATVVWSIFCLQDAALTGLRRTTRIPLENGIYGVVKLFALAAGLVVGGAAGIFLSWTIPLVLAVLAVNHVVFRRFVGIHATQTAEGQQAIEFRTVRRFITGDYAGNISAQLSVVLLPLLVIAVLGETANGYYYIAQTMATALDLLAINLAASLTVEGAHNEARLGALTIATLRRTLVIVVPVALVLIVSAPLVLSLFGYGYAAESTTVLRLLLLASILKAIVSIYGSLCRVLHRTRQSGLVQFAQAVVFAGLSLALMPNMGITGVGLAAVLAQSVLAAYVLPSLWSMLRDLNRKITGNRHAGMRQWEPAQ